MMVTTSHEQSTHNLPRHEQVNERLSGDEPGSVETVHVSGHYMTDCSRKMSSSRERTW